MDKFSWLILFTWLAGIVLSAAVYVAVIYIVYHFVSKLW